jgi:hypothetical protein
MNKKTLLLNSLLMLFSTVFSFLIVEQAYRFYLFKSASFSIKKMNSIHPIGFSGLIKPSNYDEIIYELKPNLDTYFKLAKFKTNSTGLRDKDYSLSKSSDIYRVAVIGDSYVMPSGVEIEKSFHSLLENKLNKEQTDLIYEFINFGVGGYNLRQYLGVITLKAKEYNPDLIIVGFCYTNDHRMPSKQKIMKPYKVKPKTYPFYHSYVFKSLARMLKKQPIVKKYKNNEKIFSKKQENYMIHIFSEMKTFSKKANIPIIIIYLTNNYNKIYSDKLRDIVESSGLSFADVSVPIKGLDVNDYMIYPTDIHPNEKAHAIFAEQLYKYLNIYSGKIHISPN